VIASLLLVVVAQTAPSGFTVEPYGGSVPEGTAMAWTPDGRLLVAQLDGPIRVIKKGVLLEQPFHTAAVDHPPDTDRGLLGICVDPGFASNGFVYVYFTTSLPAPHNCVRRLRANPATSDVSDGTEAAILDLENLGSDTMHNGGGIAFGPDGKLYVAVGDNALSATSQSVTSRLGKILRINRDGSIPGDNPSSFDGISGTSEGAFRAIWAAGLRNPWRFAFHPRTGRMFINDVGVSTWEEVNQGRAGANFGWEGGETDGARNLSPFTDPLFQYGHSGVAPTGRAITAGVFYAPSKPQFPSSYAGRYFFADYVAGWIYVLDPASPGTAAPFLSGASGPVDLQVGPDGALYVLARNGTPGVVRVSYATSAESPGGNEHAGDHKSCGATGFEAVLVATLLALAGAVRRRSAR
jgi:glucose/arabinose dehydrogenase